MSKYDYHYHHYHHNRKRKKIFTLPVIISIVLVLALGTVIGTIIAVDRARTRAEEEILRQFNEETKELVLERQRLTLEYDNVEKYMLDRKADGSYLGIVFTEIDDELYHHVYPMFLNREKKITGIMCIEKDAMPGDEGLISRAQYDVMRLDGWDTALLWRGNGLLRDYLTEMKAICEEEAIDFPKTLVFASGRYAIEYDKLIAEFGIENAIHHGENNLQIIDRSCDEGIWHPGMISWNTTGVSNNLLSNLMINGGIAMYEVNFSGGNEILFDHTNPYRTAAFDRMLGVFEASIVKDELVITSMRRAKEGRSFYLQLKEDSLEEIAERRIEISLQIEAINKEIDRIFEKYDKNSGGMLSDAQ